jgi:hypothetical protein
LPGASYWTPAIFNAELYSVAKAGDATPTMIVMTVVIPAANSVILRKGILSGFGDVRHVALSSSWWRASA